MTRPDLPAALHRVADLCDQWGLYVNRVVVDFRTDLGVGSGGPGQRNGVSDPTLALVLGRLAGKYPLDAMHDRWTYAVTAIDGLVPTPRGVAGTIAARLRWLADSEHKSLQRMVWPHASTIERIIHLARPMSRQAAEKLLAAEAALRVDASYCRACRSPESVLKSALCVPCYSQRRRWIERGDAQMADDRHFDRRIIEGVRRGDTFRPASPDWCATAPRRVHEEDIA